MLPLATAAQQWACQPPHTAYDFCNASLTLRERLNSVLSLMPPSEKYNNVYAAPYNTGGSSSLGIPGLTWWNEATHGATNGHNYPTTMFPMPSLTACAWNMSLVREIANTVGLEGRAASNLGFGGFNYWAPHVNLVRDPRWGRAQEVPGEDPTLTAAWAETYVRGLQEGDESTADPRYLQVIATAKHFSGYDFEGRWDSDPNRNNFDAAISDQDLADTYNVPFQSAVISGRAAGVMCSYTSINGVPSCANAFLMRTLLQDRWGFPDTGYITGDCNAVENVGDCAPPNGRCHNYTHTNSSTAAAVLAAGLTVDCGGKLNGWLPAAIEDGSVTATMVDSAVSRNLGVRFRAGVFDPPSSQPMAQWGNESVCTSHSVALSQRAAEEGVVLLKHSNSAPFPLSVATVRTLAVLGGNANDTLMQLCSYYSTPCGGFDAIITPLSALSAYAVAVNYAQGCDTGCGNTTGFAAAIAAARGSDATVLFVGMNCQLTGEGNDRGTVTLPGHADELISTACAAAAPRPCIVMLLSGGSLDVSGPMSNPNVTAMLFAGYGGPSAGIALGRTLFGDAAPPAGRLVATWYTAAYTDEVDVREMGMRPGRSVFPPGTNPGHTHRFYSGNATLFPFGYGLSLTTWRYDTPQGPARVSLRGAAAYAAAEAAAAAAAAAASSSTSHTPTAGTSAADSGSTISNAAADGCAAAHRPRSPPVLPTTSTISSSYCPDYYTSAALGYWTNVTNTGTLLSDIVVVGFLVPPGAGSAGTPLQELLGFQRVRVAPGATVSVWMGLTDRSFTRVERDGVRVAVPGAYTLRVGVDYAGVVGKEKGEDYTGANAQRGMMEPSARVTIEAYAE